MPSFQPMFMKTKGKPIQYNGQTLYLMDRFPVQNKQKILVVFEKTNSEWRQGIRIDTEGKFTLLGQQYFDTAFTFWQDTAPKEIYFTVESRIGEIWINNIWDYGDEVTQSWFNGAAMIVEELPNGKGRRYHCNDGHPDEDFDDIVFRVERVN